MYFKRTWNEEKRLKHDQDGVIPAGQFWLGNKIAGNTIANLIVVLDNSDSFSTRWRFLEPFNRRTLIVVLPFGVRVNFHPSNHMVKNISTKFWGLPICRVTSPPHRSCVAMPVPCFLGSTFQCPHSYPDQNMARNFVNVGERFSFHFKARERRTDYRREMFDGGRKIGIIVLPNFKKLRLCFWLVETFVFNKVASETT